MYRHIGRNIAIYENSGQPIATVPCLHQGNTYIKRKLEEWRALKYNFLVGAKRVQTSMNLQNTRFHASPHRAD